MCWSITQVRARNIFISPADALAPVTCQAHLMHNPIKSAGRCTHPGGATILPSVGSEGLVTHQVTRCKVTGAECEVMEIQATVSLLQSWTLQGRPPVIGSCQPSHRGPGAEGVARRDDFRISMLLWSWHRASAQPAHVPSSPPLCSTRQTLHLAPNSQRSRKLQSYSCLYF